MPEELTNIVDAVPGQTGKTTQVEGETAKQRNTSEMLSKRGKLNAQRKWQHCCTCVVRYQVKLVVRHIVVHNCACLISSANTGNYFYYSRRGWMDG